MLAVFFGVWFGFKSHPGFISCVALGGEFHLCVPQLPCLSVSVMVALAKGPVVKQYRRW